MLLITSISEREGIIGRERKLAAPSANAPACVSGYTLVSEKTLVLVLLSLASVSGTVYHVEGGETRTLALRRCMQNIGIRYQTICHLILGVDLGRSTLKIKNKLYFIFT